MMFKKFSNYLLFALISMNTLLLNNVKAGITLESIKTSFNNQKKCLTNNNVLEEWNCSFEKSTKLKEYYGSGENSDIKKIYEAIEELEKCINSNCSKEKFENLTSIKLTDDQKTCVEETTTIDDGNNYTTSDINELIDGIKKETNKENYKKYIKNLYKYKFCIGNYIDDSESKPKKSQLFLLYNKLYYELIAYRNLKNENISAQLKGVINNNMFSKAVDFIEYTKLTSITTRNKNEINRILNNIKNNLFLKDGNINEEYIDTAINNIKRVIEIFNNDKNLKTYFEADLSTTTDEISKLSEIFTYGSRIKKESKFTDNFCKPTNENKLKAKYGSIENEINKLKEKRIVAQTNGTNSISAYLANLKDDVTKLNNEISGNSDSLRDLSSTYFVTANFNLESCAKTYTNSSITEALSSTNVELTSLIEDIETFTKFYEEKLLNIYKVAASQSTTSDEINSYYATYIREKGIVENSYNNIVKFVGNSYLKDGIETMEQTIENSISDEVLRKINADQNPFVIATCFVLDLVTGNVGRIIACLFIILFGFSILEGKVRFGQLISIVIAFMLMFGAVEIANIIANNKYSCKSIKKIKEVKESSCDRGYEWSKAKQACLAKRCSNIQEKINQLKLLTDEESKNRNIDKAIISGNEVASYNSESIVIECEKGFSGGLYASCVLSNNENINDVEWQIIGSCNIVKCSGIPNVTGVFEDPETKFEFGLKKDNRIDYKGTKDTAKTNINGTPIFDYGTILYGKCGEGYEEGEVSAVCSENSWDIKGKCNLKKCVGYNSPSESTKQARWAETKAGSIGIGYCKDSYTNYKVDGDASSVRALCDKDGKWVFDTDEVKNYLKDFYVKENEDERNEVKKDLEATNSTKDYYNDELCEPRRCLATFDGRRDETNKAIWKEKNMSAGQNVVGVCAKGFYSKQYLNCCEEFDESGKCANNKGAKTSIICKDNRGNVVDKNNINIESCKYENGFKCNSVQKAEGSINNYSCEENNGNSSFEINLIDKNNCRLYKAGEYKEYRCKTIEDKELKCRAEKYEPLKYDINISETENKNYFVYDTNSNSYKVRDENAIDNNEVLKKVLATLEEDRNRIFIVDGICRSDMKIEATENCQMWRCPAIGSTTEELGYSSWPTTSALMYSSFNMNLTEEGFGKCKIGYSGPHRAYCNEFGVWEFDKEHKINGGNSFLPCSIIHCSQELVNFPIPGDLVNDYSAYVFKYSDLRNTNDIIDNYGHFTVMKQKPSGKEGVLVDEENSVMEFKYGSKRKIFCNPLMSHLSFSNIVEINKDNEEFYYCYDDGKLEDESKCERDYNGECEIRDNGNPVTSAGCLTSEEVNRIYNTEEKRSQAKKVPYITATCEDDGKEQGVWKTNGYCNPTPCTKVEGAQISKKTHWAEFTNTTYASGESWVGRCSNYFSLETKTIDNLIEQSVNKKTLSGPLEFTALGDAISQGAVFGGERNGEEKFYRAFCTLDENFDQVLGFDEEAETCKIPVIYADLYREVGYIRFFDVGETFNCNEETFLNATYKDKNGENIKYYNVNSKDKISSIFGKQEFACIVPKTESVSNSFRFNITKNGVDYKILGFDGDEVKLLKPITDGNGDVKINEGTGKVEFDEKQDEVIDSYRTTDIEKIFDQRIKCHPYTVYEDLIDENKDNARLTDGLAVDSAFSFGNFMSDIVVRRSRYLLKDDNSNSAENNEQKYSKELNGIANYFYKPAETDDGPLKINTKYYGSGTGKAIKDGESSKFKHACSAQNGFVGDPVLYCKKGKWKISEKEEEKCKKGCDLESLANTFSNDPRIQQDQTVFENGIYRGIFVFVTITPSSSGGYVHNEISFPTKNYVDSKKYVKVLKGGCNTGSGYVGTPIFSCNANNDANNGWEIVGEDKNINTCIRGGCDLSGEIDYSNQNTLNYFKAVKEKDNDFKDITRYYFKSNDKNIIITDEFETSAETINNDIKNNEEVIKYINTHFSQVRSLQKPYMIKEDIGDGNGEKLVTYNENIEGRWGEVIGDSGADCSECTGNYCKCSNKINQNKYIIKEGQMASVKCKDGFISNIENYNTNFITKYSGGETVENTTRNVEHQKQLFGVCQNGKFVNKDTYSDVVYGYKCVRGCVVGDYDKEWKTSMLGKGTSTINGHDSYVNSMLQIKRFKDNFGFLSIRAENDEYKSYKDNNAEKIKNGNVGEIFIKVGDKFKCTKGFKIGGDVNPSGHSVSRTSNGNEYISFRCNFEKGKWEFNKYTDYKYYYAGCNAIQGCTGDFVTAGTYSFNSPNDTYIDVGLMNIEAEARGERGHDAPWRGYNDHSGTGGNGGFVKASGFSISEQPRGNYTLTIGSMSGGSEGYDDGDSKAGGAGGKGFYLKHNVNNNKDNGYLIVAGGGGGGGGASAGGGKRGYGGGGGDSGQNGCGGKTKREDATEKRNCGSDDGDGGKSDARGSSVGDTSGLSGCNTRGNEKNKGGGGGSGGGGYGGGHGGGGGGKCGGGHKKAENSNGGGGGAGGNNFIADYFKGERAIDYKENGDWSKPLGVKFCIGGAKSTDDGTLEKYEIK